MKREDSRCRVTRWEQEDVRAFIPAPLPSTHPLMTLVDISLPSHREASSTGRNRCV